MADARHDLGLTAELTVAAWLTRRGWRMLAHRRRTRVGGEVDLVAVDPSGVLVAIEVRARRSARTGSGSETIDRRRTARLARSLVAIGKESGTAHAGLRIDLVLLAPTRDGDGRWTVRRIPDVGAQLSG